MLSGICFNLDQSKILSSGNGLNVADLSERVLKILGKEENLLFQECYQKLSFSKDLWNLGFWYCKDLDKMWLLY